MKPHKKNIIAMIPARMGSTRLKLKNLALIDGKSMIAYAIEASREAKIFDRIVLNSDGEIFKDIAEQYEIEFYLRPNELGSSTTKSDDVVMDFIEHFPCEIVTWVNPIAPLQTASEVRSIVKYFQDNDVDSLITVINLQAHCVYEGRPVNFSIDEKFAQTQDLSPVQELAYTVMMWKTNPFVDSMQSKGYAILNGKVCYYPVNKISGMIVKTEQDLKLVEFMMRSRQAIDSSIEYHGLAKKIINR